MRSKKLLLSAIESMASHCLRWFSDEAPSERELSSERETEGECVYNGTSACHIKTQAPSVTASRATSLSEGGKVVQCRNSAQPYFLVQNECFLRSKKLP